jgi:hypothetical protein
MTYTCDTELDAIPMGSDLLGCESSEEPQGKVKLTIPHVWISGARD